MQLNSTEMLVGPRRAQLGVSGKHLLPAHVCHPPLLCVLLQLLLRFNLYRVTSTTTGDLITLLLPHPVTTGSRFAICSVTGSSASLTPGLCSHAGRARQDASAGQGSSHSFSQITDCTGASQPSWHHLAASGKIPEQEIEIYIPRKRLWPWILSRHILRSSGSCLT